MLSFGDLKIGDKFIFPTVTPGSKPEDVYTEDAHVFMKIYASSGGGNTIQNPNCVSLKNGTRERVLDDQTPVTKLLM